MQEKHFLNTLLSIDNFDTEESHVAQKAQKAATFKRKQLTTLLAKPIFPKGFNARYPVLNNDQLDDPLLDGKVKEEKAIDVMKMAIEELSRKKVRKMPLYKPKKKTDLMSKKKLVKRDYVRGGIIKNKNKMNNKKFKKK